MNAASPYARQGPSDQQTADLFRGQWASSLPHLQGGKLESGTAGLFEDPRVPWALARLQEFGLEAEQSSFLELGPLEGGHTYGLSRAGAKSVTAIEANAHAYLKCLVAREILGYTRAQFLYGDAIHYLDTCQRTFDVAFVSGFLYHMPDPIACLEKVAKCSRALFLWTVFRDDDFSRAHPRVKAGSDGVKVTIYHGREMRLHRHSYGDNLQYQTFWGGSDSHSHWMEMPDILEVLRINGFARQIYELEANPNGSALKLVAAKNA